MDRRGQIVRHDIPDFVRHRLPELCAQAGLPLEDTGVEGRDGTGPKTEIPWTRVHSISGSPSATTGWYVVYLFSAEGDRCYLTLGRGSTVWDGVEFRPRPVHELEELVVWARNQVAARAATRPDLRDGISLDARRSNLGPAYEAGTAWALEYPIDAIPNDDVLVTDLGFMLTMLAEVLAAETVDPQVPLAEPGEVAQALEDVAALAGQRNRKGRGQGFRVNKAEQQAVERHAVALAMEHLKGLGWSQLRDVGATESYDIHGKEAGEDRFVEVKGTTSDGSSILLTPNEVSLHLAKQPANALLVVHSIQLDRTTEPPTASGGKLRELRPWILDPERLTALGFKCEV